MRVRFLQRNGAYFPGADPRLDKDEASRLIAMGVCEPYDKPTPPAKPEPPVEDPTDVDAEAPTLPAVEAPAPVHSRGPRRRG